MVKKMNLKMIWDDKSKRGKVVTAAVILAISLFFFYCFIYNDILETMRVGISFWYDLFEGRIHYFYAGRWEMNPFAYTKIVQAVYDFPIYIVFAVWNFPLWIAEKFFGVDVFNSVLCLMWGKTLLLLSSVMIARAVYQLCITLKLTKERSALAVMLFLTSNFFMTSVIMMCAYDIVALYFAIVGINYFYKNDMKKFTICFMLAIPLKFFALLIFIPLLLLKEKRIPHIIGYVFMSILPILVFRILLPCQAMYGETETVAFNIFNMFKATNLSNLAFLYVVTYEQPAALSRMYIPVFLWIILFLICYFIELKTEDDMRKWGIYVCFLTYAILFATCMSHPYWLLIMVPFAAVIMAQNYKYFYINLVLETVFTWGMIGAQIFKFPWCFGNALAAGMFLPKIFGSQESFVPLTPLTVLEKITGESGGAQGYLIGAGCSVFIAGILFFSVINFPALKKDIPFIKKDEKPAWWLVILRVIAGFAIAMLPIVMHIGGITLG